MTLQEIFDRSVTHLRKQNKQAKRGGGFCAYRDEKGGSCGVGCLIPDKNYNPDAEGATVREMVINIADHTLKTDTEALHSMLEKSGLSRTTYALLSDIQSLHDDYMDTGWRRKTSARAFDIAFRHHLCDSAVTRKLI